MAYDKQVPLTNTTIIFAIIYILYGVIKIVIGFIVMYMTPEEISKIPGLSILSKEAADKTLAGKVYEIVLMAFGVFTIIHGLLIFGFFPSWFVIGFEQKIVQYGVFFVLGAIMTIFYCLVLYTSLPIDKKTEDNDHYFTLGLIGGIGFLLSPVIWELIEYSSPYFKQLSLEKQNLLIIATIVIITVIAQIIYMVLENVSNESSVKKIITSKVEPVNTVAIGAAADIAYVSDLGSGSGSGHGRGDENTHGPSTNPSAFSPN